MTGKKVDYRPTPEQRLADAVWTREQAKPKTKPRRSAAAVERNARDNAAVPELSSPAAEHTSSERDLAGALRELRAEPPQ